MDKKVQEAIRYLGIKKMRQMQESALWLKAHYRSL